MQDKITTRLVRSLIPRSKPYEVFDTALRGFLLRVEPTGRMTYYLAYRTAEGRRGRFRLGAKDALTVRQARDLAETQAARVRTGVDIHAARQEARHQVALAKVQTLSGFIEHQYGPWLLAERPDKRHSTETLARLRANFGDFYPLPMADISLRIIEDWRAQQRRRGKAPSAINRDLAPLKALLNKAVTWEILEQNSLAPLKPLKTDALARIRYLADDEETRLRDTLAKRDARIKAGRARGNAWRRKRGDAPMPSLDECAYGDHITPMVLLTLNTGMRRGEAFHLRWHDIDWGANALTVEGSTAKTGQTRHIPLNGEALDVLTAWRHQTTGHDLVFPGKSGARLNNVNKAWAGVLRGAQIANFRWHDLRHDFASKLVMAGVALNTVRELLGHTNLNTTLRYAHLAPGHKAEAVNRLRPPLSNR
jgi:integrase